MRWSASRRIISQRIGITRACLSAARSGRSAASSSRSTSATLSCARPCTQVLLQHDIAVAAAHTNLDIARGGVNDVLAEAIGLSKLSSFVITQQGEGGETESLGRIGSLPQPMAIRDFAKQVREALPTEHVRFVDAGDRPVRKVALCSGAGAEFVDRAAMMGADAYVTGDVRYHDAQRAAELGMHVIDAGHFGTEFPVVATLVSRLREVLRGEGEVEVIADRESKDFFSLA